MTYRTPTLAPVSQLPEARRGLAAGRFCRGCGSIYSRYASRHIGKPMYGKDHVSAPCSHEGESFQAEAAWWEVAVEMLPEVAEELAPEESA
jgi:hypothetical protein